MIISCVNLKAQNVIYTKKVSSMASYNNKNVKNEKITVLSILNITNRSEIKKLDSLAGVYKNKNVRFIALMDNYSDSLTVDVRKKLLHFEYLPKQENDRLFDNAQTQMFKVFPMQIILNTKGKVKYKIKGDNPKIVAKLTKKIDRLVKQESLINNDLESQYVNNQ